METPRQRVVVLSDNELLSQAIEFCLKDFLEVEVIRFVLNSAEHSREGAKIGDVDLIVAAMSLPGSEPVVALAAASLAPRIGQVPLLIISDRPFRPEPDDKIFHLNFPYDLDLLPEKIQEILQWLI